MNQHEAKSLVDSGGWDELKELLLAKTDIDDIKVEGKDPKLVAIELLAVQRAKKRIQAVIRYTERISKDLKTKVESYE